MKLKFTLTYLIVLVSSVLRAQENEEIKLNRHLILGFQNVIETQTYEGLTRAQWNSLTPEDQNPDELDPSYESLTGNQNFFGTNYLTSVFLTIDLKEKEATKKYFMPALRIRIATGDGYSAQRNWRKTEEYRIDTLYYGSGLAAYYVDSTSNFSFEKTVNSRVRYFSVDYLWQTSFNRRFAFHGGFGAGFFVSSGLTASVYSRSWQQRSLNRVDGDQDLSNQLTETEYSDGENYSNEYLMKNYSGLQFQIPIGITLVPFLRKTNFWKNLLFDWELAFSWNTMKIKNLGRFSNTATRAAFGIKYRF